MCVLCVGQIDYIYVDERVMRRWKEYKGERTRKGLGCQCKGDMCVYRNVEHVWPSHERDELHSTRVDTMFSSDHYPLMTDLFFLDDHPVGQRKS